MRLKLLAILLLVQTISLAQRPTKEITLSGKVVNNEEKNKKEGKITKEIE